MVVYKARFEKHFGGADELKRGRPALVVDGDGPAVLFVKLGFGGWWGKFEGFGWGYTY